jgi:hypothetical protein
VTLLKVPDRYICSELDNIIDHSIHFISGWRQRCLRIHYEYHVEDPHGSIRAVLHFADLNNHEAISGAYVNIAVQQEDQGWLNALPSNTRLALWDLAAKYGNETPSFP